MTGAAVGEQEDGLAATVASFHRHLPLDKLSFGRMGSVQWDLAKPSIGSAVSETWGGVVGVFKSPVAGGHNSGTLFYIFSKTAIDNRM